MKKKILSVLFIAFFFTQLFSQSPSTRALQKHTFVYAEKDGEALRLDKYDIPSLYGEKPCVIFVFGGGFVGGERDSEYYIDYFNFLVEQGYVVVSIDYRLGLKGVTDPLTFPAALEQSINMAVEDLLDATNFVLQNAGNWQINPDMIIASGSSAGAITVLHAEYLLCNREKGFNRVPGEFNYAGVISSAGALFSAAGELRWHTSPAPMLLFHGDADGRVPFGKIEFMKYGVYGSEEIARQLHDIKSPYYFYEVINAGHEIAGSSLINNGEETISFLEKFVKEKQQLFIHTREQKIGEPDVKKNFSVEDFIRNSIE
ncbi:MAG: alpha/beta hydrolase [Candidatus Azobacteroides sp.]|nr:alpha/beta hydrolase [Candidatus Azobacteroides sp.]